MTVGISPYRSEVMQPTSNFHPQVIKLLFGSKRSQSKLLTNQSVDFLHFQLRFCNSLIFLHFYFLSKSERDYKHLKNYDLQDILPCDPLHTIKSADRQPKSRRALWDRVSPACTAAICAPCTNLLRNFILYTELLNRLACVNSIERKTPTNKSSIKP